MIDLIIRVPFSLIFGFDIRGAQTKKGKRVLLQGHLGYIPSLW